MIIDSICPICGRVLITEVVCHDGETTIKQRCENCSDSNLSKENTGENTKESAEENTEENTECMKRWIFIVYNKNHRDPLKYAKIIEASSYSDAVLIVQKEINTKLVRKFPLSFEYEILEVKERLTGCSWI